jgi:PKD repeat protein
VWDTYQQAYGETMPVDVWNIHAFVLREVYGSWGVSTPPGVPQSCGIDYAIRDADDVNIFRDNLIAFRQWMKDKGEQNKPLVISEYGILWPDWLQDEDGIGWPATRVSHFMTQTFDLLLTETYTDVGYPEDDYRLVQTWAWYSLSEDQQYNGYLFHSSDKSISLMGQTYADYTTALARADFVADTRDGIAPLTVRFTDTSVLCGPVVGWEWTFGDEGVSALQHPTHTYMTPGVYTVGLTARADGSATWQGRIDTLTRTNYITVYAPVQADFSAWPPSGVSPLTVIFTNTSTGDYVASLWSFGDGVTSTSSSATYTYTTAGTYTVTLTPNGPGGSDTKTGYITVLHGVYLPFVVRH